MRIKGKKKYGGMIKRERYLGENEGKEGEGNSGEEGRV
jgi:hypothetical protein